VNIGIGTLNDGWYAITGDNTSHPESDTSLVLTLTLTVCPMQSYAIEESRSDAVNCVTAG